MSKYRIIEEYHPVYGIIYKIQKQCRFLWVKPWWETLTETDVCNDGLLITEDIKFDHPVKAELYIRKLELPKEKSIKVIKEIII